MFVASASIDFMADDCPSPPQKICEAQEILQSFGLEEKRSLRGEIFALCFFNRFLIQVIGAKGSSLASPVLRVWYSTFHL